MPDTHGRDDGASVDDHESSQPPEKKQRQARRALSCTECKRRKTKVCGRASAAAGCVSHVLVATWTTTHAIHSALPSARRRATPVSGAAGQQSVSGSMRRRTTGELYRRRPQLTPSPAYALTTDLDSLRRQVDELKELLQVQITTTAAVLARTAEAPPVSAAPQQAAHSTPATTSSGGAPAAGGAASATPGSAELGDASAARRASSTRIPRSAVETTLKGFEASVVGTLPGTRFVGPGSVVRNAAIMRKGDTAALPRGTALERAYALLPPVDLGRAIVDEYFRGPLNRGWPVSPVVAAVADDDSVLKRSPSARGLTSTSASSPSKGRWTRCRGSPCISW